MSEEPLQSRAASHVRPGLSLWERLHKWATLPVLVSKVTLGLLGDAIFLRINSLKSLNRLLVKHVAKGQGHLTLKQVRSGQLPTGETIVDVCKSEKLGHEEIWLDADGFAPATLHFIDCRSTDGGNVILFFHGGAYTYPAGPSQVQFCLRAAKASDSKVAMLEYTLIPESKYPTQLAQAIAALRYLLKHHKPSEITVGGDSAGGNLTLALLAHMRQKHPDLPAVELDAAADSDKLRGAFCISPRCTNMTSAASFVANASKDMIGADSVALITQRWQPVPDHVWASPLHGGQDFWATIAARRIVLVAGGWECYVDDIREFARVIGAQEGVKPDRAFFVCPGEYHDMCMIDLALGVDDGVMLNRMLEWFTTL